MNTLITSMRRQQGFSMVELMVAVTLGLLLLAALGQVFVGSRQAYRAQEGVGQVQENGRFAIDLIGRQVRLAGYRPQPCKTSFSVLLYRVPASHLASAPIGFSLPARTTAQPQG